MTTCLIQLLRALRLLPAPPPESPVPATFPATTVKWECVLNGRRSLNGVVHAITLFGSADVPAETPLTRLPTMLMSALEEQLQSDGLTVHHSLQITIIPSAASPS